MIARLRRRRRRAPQRRASHLISQQKDAHLPFTRRAPSRARARFVPRARVLACAKHSAHGLIDLQLGRVPVRPSRVRLRQGAQVLRGGARRCARPRGSARATRNSAAGATRGRHELARPAHAALAHVGAWRSGRADCSARPRRQRPLGAPRRAVAVLTRRRARWKRQRQPRHASTSRCATRDRDHLQSDQAADSARSWG